MLIQPPQGQNENPYLTTLAANTDNDRNQAPAGQVQPTRREDVFTLSAAGEQRRNEAQAAAPQANENTGGAPAVPEAATAGETAPAPPERTETERAAPVPVENEQPMTRPANEAVQQQQTVAENPNTGPVTGLNVIG